MIVECIAWIKNTNKKLMKLQIDLSYFNWSEEEVRKFLKGYMTGITWSLSLMNKELSERAEMELILLDKEIE